jgi:hypothetical protein
MWWVHVWPQAVSPRRALAKTGVVLMATAGCVEFSARVVEREERKKEEREESNRGEGEGGGSKDKRG